MNNLIIKKIFYYNKFTFIKYLEKNYSSSLDILQALKKNYNNYNIKINNINQKNYLEFLNTMMNYKTIYLKNTALIINRITFLKPIELLKKKLGNEYHIILCNDIINFNVTLHCLAKQIFIKGKINIFKLDKYSNITEEYYKYLSITLDLSNSEPVIFNLT